MKEKPILFKTEMVKAILEDRKTMTRRVVKPQWDRDFVNCPYQIGQKLWVRETWAEIIFPGGEAYLPRIKIYYKASECGRKYIWKPPLFMPKKYARIWLEVTDIRVERLQDITKEDIEKEGTNYPVFVYNVMYNCFIILWDSIYIKKPEYQWNKNPYVWVIEFKRINNG